MSESRDQSPSDDYFNDLTQQMSNKTDGERRDSREENEQVPKPKRIACVLCRKRKLKCDGVKPVCGTCTRLQHDCSYDEVRRKSGPKRGYVKALEARLAQVETLLKSQDEQPTGRNKASAGHGQKEMNGNGMVPEFADVATGTANATPTVHSHGGFGSMATGDVGMPTDEPFPWEMIGLGLDEPLPTQDVVNELNQIYFEKVHPSLPMMHRPRYYAAMNLAPHMRPPVCLRYAMWCCAASVSEKYDALQEHFYQRARKYIQQDEMKGHGESLITIAHCQTWLLLATYEFKLMYFPRAWMSSGRGSRLAQMMGLHRLDGNGLDVKQCLPPPKDWTEREERRRTFWMAFCVDRYSSIGTGWPMTFEERDILSTLPSDEEAYEFNRPSRTITLAEALEASGPPNLSSFGGVVLMACLFGRNLTHLHRPGPDDKDEDLNGEFWKRHRTLDNVLLNTSLSLPDPLRLPSGLNNPNIVFLNMNIHTSTICLHQAAIFKADKNRLPSRVSAESKVRCITAAAEIASIMRQISHLDLSTMNPFISFCLYVAARVFVQYLKSRPQDAQVKASLQFLLTAMHAIKRKNPLTESFIVQLDVDLEGAGLDESRTMRSQAAKGATNVPNRSPGCPSEHLGMSSTTPFKVRATYGDNGLAAFTEPGQTNLATSMSDTPQLDAYNYTQDTAASDMPFLGTSQMDLPSRQRSPGSIPSSGNFHPEMDTSPDGSGGDNQTPSSTTHNISSHTSNTGYSPQNQQHKAPGSRQNSTAIPPDHQSTMFGTPGPVLSAEDFDMNAFATGAEAQQQSGFVLPQNWNGTSSGLTPAATAGVMPNHLGDVISMSDAEWNQVLDSFSSWETGVLHDTNIHETMARRL